MKTVAVLVGSLSAQSINLSLAKALAKLAAGRLHFDFLDIASLPHYDNALWANPPESVLTLKTKVEQADGVLIVMPEINRSFPGFLKNALDWGSRPYGKSSWAHKPTAIAGASPGAVGTAAGQGHLRAILPVYNVVLMGQPELYFQSKPGLIDENFEATDEASRAFLSGYINRFADWIDQHGEVRNLDVAAE